jgi:hypothetical protein
MKDTKNLGRIFALLQLFGLFICLGQIFIKANKYLNFIVKMLNLRMFALTEKGMKYSDSICYKIFTKHL